MDPDLMPSMATLIALELGVVGLTALATWRYARYRFTRRLESERKRKKSDPRLERLEDALDQMIGEVNRLGESQDFIQEMIAKRLNQVEQRHPLKPAPMPPPPTPA
jgi:hypothetical protein